MSRALLHIAALLLSACTAPAAPALQDGDIIFQTSRSSQSVAIQRATHSRYSHMGLVLYRSGQPYVFEASATVRYTPLRAWIARGAGGHYGVKRLADAAQRLGPDSVAKLRRAAEVFEGRPYDLTFEWSDRRLYCSELVWKAYERAFGIRIGHLQRLREFDLTDPTVRERLEQRYASGVPLDETVISPATMFAAANLVTVSVH